MKHVILLFFLMQSVSLCLLAQSSPDLVGQVDVDDANQGTGPYQFNYTGNWAHGSNTTELYFKKTCSYSNVSSNYATISFVGNNYRLTASTAPHHGILGITVDNGQEMTYDTYAPQQGIISIIMPYSASIAEGAHTIKIRVTGTKNAAATNTFVVIDYMSFLSNRSNTALGANALFYGRGSYNNTAFGADALVGNPTGLGGSNTAVGAGSLGGNRGSANTAIGYRALSANGRGGGSVAVGANAIAANYLGVENTAIGSGAMGEYVSGWWNTAIGARALSVGSGNYNIAIGAGAGIADNISVSHTIAIGATVTASNQVRIGASDITSIGGQVSWSTLSDGRFKKDIKDDVSGLEFIKQLKPVSYTVDGDAFDKFLRVPDSVRQERAKSREKPVRQTGFVAQEVESLVKKTGYVFSGVEAPKNQNDHYSIRYAEFVVPLVKAMQELAAKVETQEKVAETQQKKIEVLVEQLKKYGVNTDDLLSTDEVELFQNNPNPFSLDTEIKMTLPETALQAKVIVYTMEGKQLRDLPVKGRGKTSVKISGSELGQGMYLYALIVDGKVEDTKRMILTK